MTAATDAQPDAARPSSSSSSTGAPHDAARATVEELVANDLRRERKEHLFCAPDFVADLVLGEGTTSTPYKTAEKDPRIPMADAERRMLDAVFSLSLCSLLSAGAMFIWATETWHGLLYTVTKLVLLERFMLTLHFSQHRLLVKNGPFKFLNHLMPMVIAPTFGMPSGAYQLHHILMHHRGNNLWPDDLSQTMTMQRDSFVEFFFKYWLRFVTTGVFELVALGLRLKYTRGVQKFAIGAVLQAVVTYKLWSINPTATFWVLLAPYLWATFGMMLGNWSQHIFVDPSDPGNSYKLTYNCVDAPMNGLTFNDGYHIAHHLQGGRHWSKLPEHLTKNYEKYVENDALVFKGVGFVDVGWMVVTGQLEKLCDHVVLPVLPRSELVALMKRRLEPIPVKPGQKFKIV